MIDFDKDTAFTRQVLGALSARTKMAMHNIANQNTPGFKRFEVRFEDLLTAERARAGAGEDLGRVSHEIVRVDSGPQGQNNVVLMDELALLGKTALLHDLMTQRLSGYKSNLNKAVFGR